MTWVEAASGRAAPGSAPGGPRQPMPPLRPTPGSSGPILGN
ncbi:MAG: hypothetical protein JWO67_3714 [Streptosporangiaceae bacterium]|nr:hypothetical protein [Streptosporangiaceae bacterium]